MRSMPAAGIIYYARNKLNGKVYIGQTVQNIGVRKWKHISDANTGKDTYFGRALRKHGLEGFNWEILCPVEALTNLLLKEYLNIAEQMFIEQYDSTDRKKGYNSTNGGGGIIGFHFHHSAETKEKLKEIAKGRRYTKETKEKMSKSQTGRHHSVETREKMSKSRMGIRYTAETIEKMSKAKKGDKHPMFGKQFSDERKRKISEGNKGRPVSSETRKKTSETLKRKHLSDDEYRKQNRKQLKKLSEANKGSHRSENTRKKMSESARKRWSRRVAA